MASRKVLVTDYAWPNLDTERNILAQAGVSVVSSADASQEELVALARDVDGILTCWKPVREAMIEQATNCVCIGRYGIGLDNIDVAYASRFGIIITNVPDYCIEEVSDHALALLLACARRVAFFDADVKRGVYSLAAQAPLYRLRGKVLGIVGFGKIGRAVQRKATCFGLEVIACSVRRDGKVSADSPVMRVDFEELLERSDYVSIHVPLTSETRHLFGSASFSKMKRTAFLINTSRGEVVDHAALLQALNTELIAGAALDVLPKEPPDKDDLLSRHPKAIITPHAAFSSSESISALQMAAARQMAAVLNGEIPDNIVNPEVLVQPNLRLSLEGKR